MRAVVLGTGESGRAAAAALESDVAKLNAEVKDLTEQNKKLAAGEAVRKSLEAENKTLTDSKAASEKRIADLPIHKIFFVFLNNRHSKTNCRQ